MLPDDILTDLDETPVGEPLDPATVATLYQQRAERWHGHGDMELMIIETQAARFQAIKREFETQYAALPPIFRAAWETLRRMLEGE